MRTEESTISNHGEFAFGEQMRATALEHRCKAKKLDSNLLDALWDRLQVANRAAGPWGALAMWRRS